MKEVQSEILFMHATLLKTHIFFSLTNKSSHIYSIGPERLLLFDPNKI